MINSLLNLSLRLLLWNFFLTEAVGVFFVIFKNYFFLVCVLILSRFITELLNDYVIFSLVLLDGIKWSLVHIVSTSVDLHLGIDKLLRKVHYRGQRSSSNTGINAEGTLFKILQIDWIKLRKGVKDFSKNIIHQQLIIIVIRNRDSTVVVVEGQNITNHVLEECLIPVKIRFVLFSFCKIEDIPIDNWQMAVKISFGVWTTDDLRSVCQKSYGIYFCLILEHKSCFVLFI